MLPVLRCRASLNSATGIPRSVSTIFGSREGPEALRRARVELPVGPRLFHLLAETDRTAAVAKQLVAAGEDISMQDNNRMDALAYALTSGDAKAAGRLLAAGARPDSRVGPEQMPVALVPVLMGDTEAVALLQRAGVNYSQLRFRGLTALDVARQRQDEAMVRALGRRGSRL